MHDALPLVVGHHEAKQNIHQTHHSKRKINTAFTGVQINHMTKQNDHGNIISTYQVLFNLLKYSFFSMIEEE